MGNFPLLLAALRCLSVLHHPTPAPTPPAWFGYKSGGGGGDAISTQTATMEGDGAKFLLWPGADKVCTDR